MYKEQIYRKYGRLGHSSKRFSNCIYIKQHDLYSMSEYFEKFLEKYTLEVLIKNIQNIDIPQLYSDKNNNTKKINNIVYKRVQIENFIFYLNYNDNDTNIKYSLDLYNQVITENIEELLDTYYTNHLNWIYIIIDFNNTSDFNKIKELITSDISKLYNSYTHNYNNLKKCINICSKISNNKCLYNNIPLEFYIHGIEQYYEAKKETDYDLLLGILCFYFCPIFQKFWTHAYNIVGKNVCVYDVYDFYGLNMTMNIIYFNLYHFNKVFKKYKNKIINYYTNNINEDIQKYIKTYYPETKIINIEMIIENISNNINTITNINYDTQQKNIQNFIISLNN